MENLEKELKIIPPEGYEIDKENSTLECIKFKKIEKPLIYEDIAKELFLNKESYHLNNNYLGKRNITALDTATQILNFTSKKQANKLMAINKLLNVAKYLNKGWEPDWNDGYQTKWIIKALENNANFMIIDCFLVNPTIVCFETKELAQQAINILGKDTIKLALSTDW